MKTVLFICTGNAGRSQMAEAMFRALAGDRFSVLSAGVDPWDDLHPMARKLMAERGLDLAGHHPKHVRGFVNADFEVAVTIGDRAEAESPEFPTGTRRIHWAIDDPANADGTADSETVFCWTRDQIEQRLPSLVNLLRMIPQRQDCKWAPAMSTTIFRARGFKPAQHLPMCAAAGFYHIELCCYADTADFDWENAATVAELKRIADDCGVAILSIHPPDRANLAAPDPKAREVQKDVLRRFLELAERLGAGSPSFHVGYGLPTDHTRATAIARQTAALDELAEYAAPSPVALCVETLSGRPSDLPNRAVIELALERSAAAYGVVLDTGHPNLAGDLYELAAYAGRRLLNLHLNDNHGQGDPHLIPGQGNIDWARLLQSLRENDYQGPLMLEVCPGPELDPKIELEKCRQALNVLH